MVSEAFVIHQVAKSLGLIPLFSLRATGMYAREACLEESVWSEIVSRELHGFDLPAALLKPAEWYHLAPLFREFRRAQATVNDNVRLCLGEATLVQKMARVLGASTRWARPQLSQGSKRHVLVGSM